MSLLYKSRQRKKKSDPEANMEEWQRVRHVIHTRFEWMPIELALANKLEIKQWLGLGQAAFVQFANDWTLNTFTSQLEKFAQKNNGSISNCHTTCSIYSIRSGWCVISYMPHNVCVWESTSAKAVLSLLYWLVVFIPKLYTSAANEVSNVFLCLPVDQLEYNLKKNRLEMVMSSKQKWIRVADIRITVNEFVKTYNVIML